MFAFFQDHAVTCPDIPAIGMPHTRVTQRHVDTVVMATHLFLECKVYVLLLRKHFLMLKNEYNKVKKNIKRPNILAKTNLIVLS